MQIHPIPLFATLPDVNLTSTRVPFADANGVLTDSAAMTFASDTLTVTKIGAFEATGAINFANQNMDNVDIDSGAMDGTVIGANNPENGLFDDITAGSSFFVDESRKELILGGTTPVVPYSVFPGQDNITLFVQQQTETANNTPFAALVFSNHTTKTDGNVAQFLFMNEEIGGANNRLFQMLVMTDGAINAGKMIFRSWNAGSFVNGLTLDKDGNATFAAAVSVTGNTTLGTSTINDVMTVVDNVAISFGEGTILSNGANVVFDGDDSASDLLIGKFQEVRIGTPASTYMQIDIDGDAFFVGSGTGWPYANIYAQDNATPTTISLAGKANKVQITVFDTNGLSNLCTPDHTNDHITIVKAGVYIVHLDITASGAGGDQDKFGFSLYKNNGTTEFPNVHGHETMAGGAGDINDIMLVGLIDVAVNDTIEVWVWNEDDTDDLTIDDIGLTLIQVGGT